MDYGQIGTLLGCKVIVSQYAYKTVIRVRCVPDAHKPNARRRYFHKVAVRVPQCFTIGSDVLVAAPEIAAKIKQEAERVENAMIESMGRRIEQEIARSFGLPLSVLTNPRPGSTLTAAVLNDSMMRAMIYPSPVDRETPLLRYGWGSGVMLPNFHDKDGA
jgi:hypothetical protein